MKKFLICILSIMLLTAITGCKSKNKPNMKADLADEYLYLQSHIKIDSVETIKRKTEEDVDEIYVKVFGKNESIKSETQYLLTYIYYNEGGWILEDVVSYATEEWIISPIVGVSDAQLSADAMEFQNSGFGELDTYFDSVTVSSTEVDLEAGSVFVDMQVDKSSPFRELSGTLSCLYNFYNEYDGEAYVWSWVLADTSSDFNITYPGLEGTWFGEYYISGQHKMNNKTGEYYQDCSFEIDILDDNRVKVTQTEVHSVFDDGNYNQRIVYGIIDESGIDLNDFELDEIKDYISYPYIRLVFEHNGTTFIARADSTSDSVFDLLNGRYMLSKIETSEQSEE